MISIEMGKIKINKRLFHSKALIFSLIFSFILLIATEATPDKVDSDSNKEFKPVVRVKEAGKDIPASQKERFERLIKEGKRLLLEEMDYEGAIIKFNEAKNLAISREQKADTFFYLSLVFFASSRETRVEDCDETIRKLIEIDYHRELDSSLCPPRYMELFRGIKKEYGVLVVQSKPAGADVYINDSKDPLGKTPLTIGSKAGSVKIKVKKGKKEKKEILRVIAGKDTTSPIYILKGGSSLLLVLGGIVLAGGGAVALFGGKKGNGGGNGGAPAPTTGSIQVNSTPTGAQVYLDGSNTGQTTNCTITNVSPGSHTIDLILEGYEDEQRTVSVTAGQTATVNATLTKPTITVIELPPDTVWTTGTEVEIKWDTSGSGSLQGIASTGAALNSLMNQGRRAVSRFQRRAFQQRRFQRRAMKEGSKLENVNSSGYRGKLTGNISKPQGASGKFSSTAKEGDIVHKRTKDTGNIKRKSIVGRVNIPVAPQISTEKFTQSGNTRVLGLSYVKIDLYKGNTLNQTIAESTENDGSYLWIVDPSLEDGTDYKVRISNPNDSTSYGESEEFEIRSFQDIEWVQVPAGTFEMGDNFNEGYTDEKPVHTVYLDTYYISKYEVTFDQYDTFCDATGRSKPSDKDWGRGDRPVINVDWNDAKAFCDWLSARTGENIHLPTEAQWEKAARGTDQRRYPWGNGSPDSTLANYNSNVGKTMPVGSYPAGVSPYGIHDMAGNVWEWCSDWYDANYYSSSPTSNPQGPSSGSLRVERGGGWTASAGGIRSAVRPHYPPSDRGGGVGFRLCKDVPVANSITVTEPTSSTIWRKGQSADITWTSTGTISDVKIDLYKGGTFNQKIVSSTGNNGSYTWAEVDTSLADGTDYKVRVASIDDSTVYGESEEFEIRSFQDIEWVQIPAGTFEMGDNFNEGYTDEKPVHTVYLDTYYISKYEVTFEQYDAFCDDTSRTKPDDAGWGRGDMPVIFVSWNDAMAFCDWMSARTGENIHLPTEAQWEKAARGTDQRRYPWGNGSPDSTLANYNSNVGKTMPVGSYPVGLSPYGVHDMAGNVYEWCSDWYDDIYYSSSPTNNPQGPSSGTYRVIRGGSWYGDEYHIRSALRNIYSPSNNHNRIGFRLCKDVPVANSITVTEPTSSTIWRKGQSADITWTSTGTISNVNIDLYKGSTLEQTITSSTENDGSYTWAEVDTSLADGTDYKVRVYCSDDLGVYGESDVFIIEEKSEEKSITVTEPTDTTVWVKDFPAEITWTSNGTISDVKIDLYKGSTLEQTIASSTENDGSYTWAEVDTSLADGTDYKVRISSTDDPGLYGESEEFGIRSFQEIEWVQVPAGSFEMGDNFNEGRSDELPVHTVYLDTYYISKYEVTFDQYDAFCDATGRTKPSDAGWGRGDRPVIWVSWNDAKAFCDWLSARTGENIHLPTEAQWEKAARGTDQRRHPWGNGDPDSTLANYSSNVGKTMPVGSYPAGVSPYGIHDMAGNVYEWCSDWYDDNYYSSSPTNNPQGPSSGSERVRRGGGWFSSLSYIRSASRNHYNPSLNSNHIGFRLCKD